MIHSLRDLARDHRWLIVWGLALLALGLGFVGFRERGHLVGQESGLLGSLYLALQLFTLESGAVDLPVPISLQVARFLAPATAAYTAAVALLALFREEIQALRSAVQAQNPRVPAWEDLVEDLKDSNRHQADHIPVKLRAIGCEMAPIAGPRALPLDLSPQEVEALARMEHERWCAEKRIAGWTPGTQPDDARKVHPDLVDWDQLSEGERDKDRQTVRNIPAFLAAVGQDVHRVWKTRYSPRPGSGEDSLVPGETS